MADQSARATRREITEDDGVAIRQLHAEGRSQTATAAELGIDRPTLSRWSKRHGLSWHPTPVAALAQAERLRHQRLTLAEQVLNDAIEIRKRLWDNTIEHFATRDGVETVTLDLPGPRQVADLASAIERLTRVGEHLADTTGRTVESVSMLQRLQMQIRDYARTMRSGQDGEHDD